MKGLYCAIILSSGGEKILHNNIESIYYCVSNTERVGPLRSLQIEEPTYNQLILYSPVLHTEAALKVLTESHVALLRATQAVVRRLARPQAELSCW